MLQAAASRNEGSRPRANSSRSASSSAATTRTAPTTGSGPSTTAISAGSCDQERDAEDDVDGQQLDALEPVRLALVGHVVGDHHRQQDGADLEAVEDERHR